MLRLLAILLIVNTYYTSVESFFHEYTKLTSGHYEGSDDPGEPLFLTPFVEKGDIETGRKLASVPSDQWLGVKSYAGFFTVDKKHDSNHFFWYFPSMTNVKDAPVILWLNGGPGASSLYGAFIENGPISFFDGKALAYTIHHRNPNEKIKIKLKGIAIGDGWCDPINQIGYDKYLYQLGLIDHNQNKAMYKLRHETESIIRQKDWKKASDKIDELTNMAMEMSGVPIYNFVSVKKGNEKSLKDIFGIIFKQAAVRKSLHVGKLSFDETNTDVYENLRLDFSQSVAPWISELLDYYKVFIYNGELDIIVGYPLTEKFLRHLIFRDRDEYLSAERQVIKCGSDIVGWAKQGGKLTEMLIRKAGHMVPEDQPKWTWDIITAFTYGTTCVDPNTNRLNKWHRDICRK